MRRFIATTVASLALMGFVASGASAASPGTNGQPGESCGSSNAFIQPAGFSTGGFTNAANVYAGSPGTPSLANGNAAALSQYDVACFEVTSSHSG